MSTVDTYAPGTPCWVELGTTDLDAAKAFYTAVFGWGYDVAGPEAGFYTMPMIAGKPVAGMMTQGEDEKALHGISFESFHRRIGQLLEAQLRQFARALRAEDRRVVVA